MELMIQGFQLVMTPSTILYICFGTVMGVIFGALPGVSASMAVVLCISFTYTMSPLLAIAFLVSVYCSSITGGGITAILFRIPGTPASAATTFDGYPLTMRGEAGKALGVSLYSSAIGGLFSAICMFLLTQPLMEIALKFGSAEQFALMFFGLSILGFLDRKNLGKTFASGLMGLWIATVGIDFLSSTKRFTFSQSFLLNGIGIIPAMVGIFAVAEVFKQAISSADKQEYEQVKLTKLVSLWEMWRMRWTLLRNSIIGTIVGIVPGTGAAIAAFLAYATEIKLSKHPEQFGKGVLEGIAAPESANNAATGGTMVPLLALGIPGGNAAAMIMMALSMHGVIMGPMLLQKQPEYLSTVFAAMVLCNIFMVFVSIWVAKGFATILNIPYSILGFIILMLSTVGSYATNGSINDVYIMAAAGVFGYYFNRYGFNQAALVLGMVLGQMCETNFRRALTLAGGNIFNMIKRPITGSILLVILIMFIFPYVQAAFKKPKQVQ